MRLAIRSGPWLLGLMISSLAAHGATRVALVASGDDAGAVLALAAAQLSEKGEVELVERTAIDAVLAEQKLTLSGLVDATQAVQVGRLVKADLFAVVDSDQKGRPIGMIVWDSATGLRLENGGLAGKPTQMSDSVALMVGRAVAKSRGLSGSTRLVAFLPVRNADLPVERDASFEAVRYLLERELSASPGIAILERSRLEQLNLERQLPTTLPSGDLWPSMVVLQLEFSRSTKPSSARVSATFNVRDDKDIPSRIEVEGDDNSPAELVEQLRDRLAKSLHAPAITRSLNRDGESERYMRNSQVLTGNGHFQAGAEAAEAAYALQPEKGHRLLLAKALWGLSQHELHSLNGVVADPTITNAQRNRADVYNHALKAATRALMLQQESLRIRLAAHYSDRFYLEYTGGEQRITDLLNTWPDLRDADARGTDYDARLESYRLGAIEYLQRYFDGWARHAKAHAWDLPNYNAELVYAMDLACELSRTFAEFTTIRDHLIRPWIASFDAVWPNARDRWLESGARQSMVMRELLAMDGSPSRSWQDFSQPALAASLKAIAGDLTASSCPVQRMYGMVAGAIGETQPELRGRAIESLAKLLDQALAKPGSTPVLTRRDAIIAFVDGVELLSTRGHCDVTIAIALLERGLRRKELIPYCAMEELLSGVAVTEGQSTHWSSVLEKTLQLSRAVDTTSLDGNADGLARIIGRELRSHGIDQPGSQPSRLIQPWISSSQLASISGLRGMSRLEEFPQLSGERLCFLGSGVDGNGNFFLQAFEVSLSGEAPRPLARMAVSKLPGAGDPDYFPRDGFVYRLIQGAAVDDHNFYVSVRWQGVVVFPRDGSPAFRIDHTQGLPSDHTQSLVALDGNLYITSSLERRAYLVKWNPNDHNLDVLISTQRKQTRSPLDNTAALRIDFLIADPPHHRLLLGASHFAPDADWNQSRGGLWRIFTKDAAMKHLLTDIPEEFFGYCRGIDGDSLYITTTVYAIQYGLGTGTACYVFWKPGAITENGRLIREMDVGKKTIKGSGWTEPDWEHAGTRTVINHWLWTGEPFERISADGRNVEAIDPQLKPGEPPIGPVWTILSAGENRVVLGDIRQLYVVKLSSAPTTTATTQSAH